MVVTPIFITVRYSPLQGYRYDADTREDGWDILDGISQSLSRLKRRRCALISLKPL